MTAYEIVSIIIGILTLVGTLGGFFVALLNLLGKRKGKKK